MPPIVAMTAISAAGAFGSAALSSRAAGSAADKQTAAANHAANLQAQSAREALDYTKQQASRDAVFAEANRRGNYDQWAAGQQTNHSLLQGREARLGYLGSLIRAPGRMPVSTDIPAYVPMDPNAGWVPPGSPVPVNRPALPPGSLGAWMQQQGRL